MEKDLLPIEEEIKRYFEVNGHRDKFGLKEVHSYLENLGYHHDKNLTNSVLMGLCFKGYLIFLGWHRQNALYQKMD